MNEVDNVEGERDQLKVISHALKCIIKLQRIRIGMKIFFDVVKKY